MKVRGAVSIYTHIITYIVLYSSIYIAPLTSHGPTEARWVQLAPEKRQVLRGDKDVERFEDKKEARAEGGRQLQRKGRANNGKGPRFSHSCASPKDKGVVSTSEAVDLPGASYFHWGSTTNKNKHRLKASNLSIRYYQFSFYYCRRNTWEKTDFKQTSIPALKPSEVPSS